MLARRRLAKELLMLAEIPILPGIALCKGAHKRVPYRLGCVQYLQIAPRYKRKTANILTEQKIITLSKRSSVKQTDVGITGGIRLCKQIVACQDLCKSLPPLLLRQQPRFESTFEAAKCPLANESSDNFVYLKHTYDETRSVISDPQYYRSSSVMFTKLLTRFVSTLQTRFMSTLPTAAVAATTAKNSTGSGEPIAPDDAPLDPKGRKRMKINACGKLYRELSITKPELYRGAPQGRGIDFDLEYYDTMNLLPSSIMRSRAPIVCLLHGAPGSYSDFGQLICHLTEKGVRVLAPNFPTYSATYKHSFRHSPRERLDFLLEFFKTLDVKAVDMLICHSSAVYTVFELLNQSLTSSNDAGRIAVKSLGLFSTPTYNLPSNLAVTPFRLYTLKLFDYAPLRPVIIALINVFVKLQGIRNKVDPNQIENLLIAASAVGYSDCDKMAERLKLLHQFNIPTFLLIGCNDRLIPMKCFEQLKRDLCVDEGGQVKHYGPNGHLIKDISQPDELVLVSQFESGGHYVFQKFSTQVNEDVYSFMTRKVLSPRIVESTKL